MKFNKEQVAARQLDTAIWLMFNQKDIVSVHTLASASLAVFSDLLVASGENSWRERIIEGYPGGKKEANRLLNKAANFFKHADKDPNKELEFNETDSDEAIIVATLEYGELMQAEKTANKKITTPMAVFQLWYFAKAPDLLLNSSNEEGRNIVKHAQSLFPKLRSLSRVDQLSLGANILDKEMAKRSEDNYQVADIGGGKGDSWEEGVNIMENKMDRYELYKDLYFFEIDRKQKLTNGLGIPIGFATVLASAIFFYLREFNFSQNFTTLAFLGLLTFALFKLGRGIYFIIKSNYDYSYRYLPKGEELEDYFLKNLGHNEKLEKYNKKNDLKDIDHLEKSSNEFKSFLIRKFVHANQKNGQNNRNKSEYMHSASGCLIYAFVIISISAVPYFIQEHIHPDKAPKVEIINFNEKPR